MDALTAASSLARASAVLTERYDVAGGLVSLLRLCKEAIEVDAAGILIRTQTHLELLAASSHEASELETHQSQLDSGPCIEAYETQSVVKVTGRDDLTRRWPTFAPIMLEADFQSVHASPLTWRDTTIGAMGLFRRTPDPFTTDDDIFAQAFADIATLLIVSVEDMAAEELSAKLERVLSSRVVIEQAKGVLAEERHLGMNEAYEMLVQDAVDRNVPLSQWAAQILGNAR